MLFCTSTAVEKKRMIWTTENSLNRVRIMAETQQLKEAAASGIRDLACLQELPSVTKRIQQVLYSCAISSSKIIWLNTWSNYVMPLHNILFIVFVQNGSMRAG